MRIVADVLLRKGSHAFTVSPDATVYDALVTMARHDVGAVVVVEGGRVEGLFSERDYARKVILRGATSKQLRVRDIMTKPAITVTPHHHLDDCMQLMTDRRVRHLPVMERGWLVGVISIGDVVKSCLADREDTIQQLEEYIRHGG